MSGWTATRSTSSARRAVALALESPAWTRPRSTACSPSSAATTALARRSTLRAAKPKIDAPLEKDKGPFVYSIRKDGSLCRLPVGS